MGNRAVITTNAGFRNIKGSDQIGVYLHWNGGRDSVEAFLAYCKLQGFRAPEHDCYGWARLCQVIANYFGADGLSIGVDRCCNLDCDNWDNGVYVIENWEIVDRQYHDGHEQQVYDLQEMLIEIDEAQPAKMQLGKMFLTAPVVPTAELNVGDHVWVGHFGTYELHEVVGIGEDRMVNGRNVKGIPFVDLYLNDGDYTSNPNNYLFGAEYRRLTLVV